MDLHGPAVDVPTCAAAFLQRCCHCASDVAIATGGCCLPVYISMQNILDPTNSQLRLVLDLHDPAVDVPTRVASFLQVSATAKVNIFVFSHAIGLDCRVLIAAEHWLRRAAMHNLALCVLLASQDQPAAARKASPAVHMWTDACTGITAPPMLLTNAVARGITYQHNGCVYTAGWCVPQQEAPHHSLSS